MNKRKDWLKFWLIVISINLIVFSGIFLTWFAFKDSDKVGYIAMPIALWIFAMFMTLIGIYLIEKEDKVIKQGEL